MINSAKKFAQSYLQDSKGATAIEFALIAIPFLLIILGTMEAGRSVWIVNSVRYSIEETTRYAAINGDLADDALQSYARGKLNEINVNSANLMISSTRFTSNSVDFVRIDGQYTLQTILNNFFPGEFGNFTIETSAKRPVVN